MIYIEVLRLMDRLRGNCDREELDRQYIMLDVLCHLSMFQIRHQELVFKALLCKKYLKLYNLYIQVF